MVNTSLLHSQSTIMACVRFVLWLELTSGNAQQFTDQLLLL